jgi:5'-nucleotidase
MYAWSASKCLLLLLLHRDSPADRGCVRPAVTGEQILAALNNGVSMYPRLEGRFPLVSGLSFEFDSTLPSGALHRCMCFLACCACAYTVARLVLTAERVIASSVEIGGKPLMRYQRYNLATKQYLASGHDGYTRLVRCSLVCGHDPCVRA